MSTNHSHTPCFGTLTLPGFGFVSFANEEGAKKAIEGMHESELGGRSITVRMAGEKPPERKPGEGSGAYVCIDAVLCSCTKTSKLWQA